MARTKQTARKSTGGKAPRKQLACKSSRALRAYFTAQQSVGRGSVGTVSGRSKTSFINTENTFNDFSFAVPGREAENLADTLVPRLATAKAHDAEWLGVSFASSLDGAGMSAARDELKLRLCLVIDISGSMGWGFETDGGGPWGSSSGPSKLDVAKQCVLGILAQMKPSDEISIILFNHGQEVLLPLQSVQDLDFDALKASVERLSPCGGTRLADGFAAGTSMLHGGSGGRGRARGGRAGRGVHTTSRLIFLTDMQSGPDDEDQVLTQAAAAAAQGIYTTIVGVGVDLSVGAVQRISGTPGGKYMSVSNAGEFEERLGAEFLHDCFPIAFDIRVTLDPGLGITFEAGYGHPEVAGLAGNGESTFRLSSEFASPNPGDTGIILLKLRPGVPGRRGKKSGGGVTVEWKTLAGEERREHLALPEPAETREGSAGAPHMFSCTGIRKAIALQRLVKLQDEYMMEDSPPSQGPEGIAMSLQASQKWVASIAAAKEELLREMDACLDPSLGSNNRIFLDTLGQMEQCEQDEVQRLTKELAEAKKQASNKKKPTASNRTEPADFLCPITKLLMEDPVLAADGHSYERRAIEEWFARGRLTSPVTNERLTSSALIPNYALKSAIQSHLSAGTRATPARRRIEAMARKTTSKPSPKPKRVAPPSVKAQPTARQTASKKRTPAKKPAMARRATRSGQGF